MSEENEEFLSLLAHELRTPVAAIIGYHDLMSEGILGDIDPRIAESLVRIRSSADQMLALVASLGEAATDAANLHVDVGDEDPRVLVENVLRDMMIEASGRATNVQVNSIPDPGVFHTDNERVERALRLALHAAIKVSAGGSIQFDAFVDDDGAFVSLVRGARLDPTRENFDGGVASAGSSAALRLAMARQAIRPLGGTLTLVLVDAESVLTIRVPPGRAGD